MVDEEIQTPPENTVEGYQVKEEFKPILSKIIRKHGDIAKNCVTEFREIRSLLLEMICGVILEFEKKDVTEIKESVLTSKLAIVDGIKKMNVEVEWLIKRVAEVLEARELLMQYGMLKEKTDKNRKRIEECENALDKCKEQKKELFEKMKALCDEEVVCEGNLAKVKEASAKIPFTNNFFIA
jgi:chromosome segregation ATPase